jgi:hypothetical protein
LAFSCGPGLEALNDHGLVTFFKNMKGKRLFGKEHDFEGKQG